jgi:hypothetical protein
MGHHEASLLADGVLPHIRCGQEVHQVAREHRAVTCAVGRQKQLHRKAARDSLVTITAHAEVTSWAIAHDVAFVFLPT